jgi:hypothetical protein
MEVNKPDFKKIPGGCDMSACDISLQGGQPVLHSLFPGAQLIKNAFTVQECDALIALFNRQQMQSPVSVQGRGEEMDYRQGSMRTTGWCENISNRMWEVLRPYIPSIQINRDEPTFPTDWWQEPRAYHWEAVNMSPMLRFMRYTAGGQHYGHYDAAYFYPDKVHRTLLSVILYLSTHSDSGATRFLEDNQGHLPIWDRDHADWAIEAREEQLFAKVHPQKGSVLIFPHRKCHDVQVFKGPGERIIIRGDIIFKPHD